MGKRILFINPICTDVYDQPMKHEFERFREPDTVIDVVSLKQSGCLHLVYTAYEALIIPEMIEIVRQAEADHYDAVCIGCFYDPALRACREVAKKMVVAAPAEASLHIAATLGERIAILVGEKKCIPEMHENAVKYGFENKVAAWKSLDLGVHDFQKDPQLTYKRMQNAVKASIEQNLADVVVLGCTAEFGFFNRIQEEFSVPCIDPSIAAVTYAEFLIELNQKCGWSHSKIFGYQSPPESEVQEWQLFR